MKKNDIIEVEITDIGASGEGISHLDGFTVFVPFALTGEQCKVHVLKVKDNLVWAKLVETIKENEKRCDPKCKFYKKCGGCVLEHVSSEYELEIKKQKIQTAFKKYAGMNDLPVLMVDSNKRYGYRNKCAFPVRMVNGRAKVCMFRYNTHTAVEIDRCEIAEEEINTVVSIFNNFLEKHNITAYDEQTNSGLVKFIVIRVISGVPLITVVINGKDVPNKKDLITALSAKFKSFGLNFNINKKMTNVILTDEIIHVYGEKELSAFEFGIHYPISSLSFMQVNNFIKTEIYNRVLDKVFVGDTVIDAYSGAGLLSAIIAKKAKKVYGIEIIKAATNDANELAKLNNINNLININGDCAVELPKLCSELDLKSTKVVLDPPRKGCDQKVIDTIISSKIEEIIYISCNPATLARDSKILLDNGFKISEVIGFNMFPNTEHVETLITFIKGG